MEYLNYISHYCIINSNIVGIQELLKATINLYTIDYMLRMSSVVKTRKSQEEYNFFYEIGI